MKEIKVIKTKFRPLRRDLIAVGCYGGVFRFSQRRIIKLYLAQRKSDYLFRLLADEILGSQISEDHLPVISVAVLRKCYSFSWLGSEPTSFSILGLIKPFVPKPYPVAQGKTFDHKWPRKYLGYRTDFDLWDHNIGMDSKGKLWVLDTQLNPEAAIGEPHREVVKLAEYLEEQVKFQIG